MSRIPGAIHSGIIHAFENHEGDISSSTLEHAYKICKLCSQHYLNHIAEEPEIVTLTNLLVQDIRRVGTPHGNEIRFQKSLIQQIGNSKLRNLKSRNMAIHLLIKLGHLREAAYNGGGYEFRNVVWPNITPELKNGEGITISELPLWSEQILVNIDPRGRYDNERILKPNNLNHLF